MVSQWYIIQAYSGFEKKVAASIKDQAEAKGLGKNIEEVLVPTEEVVEYPVLAAFIVTFFML